MTQQSQVIRILLLAAEPTDLARISPSPRVPGGTRSLLGQSTATTSRSNSSRPQHPLILRRTILDHRPQIVQFCGHGTGGSGLALEDEQGATRRFRPKCWPNSSGSLARPPLRRAQRLLLRGAGARDPPAYRLCRRDEEEIDRHCRDQLLPWFLRRASSRARQSIRPSASA